MSTPLKCKQRLLEFEQTYHQAKDIIEEIEKKKHQLKDVEYVLIKLVNQLQKIEKVHRIMRLRCDATEINLPSYKEHKVAFDNMANDHRKAVEEAKLVSNQIESLKIQIEEKNVLRNCYNASIVVLEKSLDEICEKMELFGLKEIAME